MMSDIVGAKAISAVQRGAVVEKPHARVFEVERSGGGVPYVVVIGAGDELASWRPTSCTCPAGMNGRRCYHVAAAGLLIAKQREAGQRAGGEERPNG